MRPNPYPAADCLLPISYLLFALFRLPLGNLVSIVPLYKEEDGISV